MKKALIIGLVWALCGSAGAQTTPPPPETIVAGLSQSRVAISTDFAGSEILIYGAIKRDTAPPDSGALQVIITVEGPPAEIAVRRKERVWGIWVNTEEVIIDRAPSFYAIASTAPLADILLDTEDLRHRISTPRAIRAVGTSAEASSAPDFIDAMVRLRQSSGNYIIRQTGVRLTEDTLFRADIALPTNLTEGDYRVRFFLTRDRRVIDRLEQGIIVRKTGLERFFFSMAREQPLAYGLMALLVAALAGWAASAVFRWLRP